MRRAVALLLAAVTLATASGGFFATPPAAAPPPADSAPAYGPHWMLPDPAVYRTVPFTQPAGWTGTPPTTKGTGGAILAATGVQKVLVLLIDFTDRASSVSSGTIDTLVNDASAGAVSVRNYYYENSYGQLTLEATVAGWFHSSHTMEYYGADSSSTSFDDANGPVYGLVTEAVRQAAAPGPNQVDFSQFDLTGSASGGPDGVVDHVIVVHAGGAQEETGVSNQIWSHRWSVIDADPSTPGNQRLVENGVQVFGYIMVAEDSPVGVFAHELGHDFGLPDLYDTDGSSSGGVGDWDIMASGSWNALSGGARGTMPAQFSAWSKLQLGWTTPTTVTVPLLGQGVDAMETRTAGGAAPHAFKLPVRTISPGQEEYFLVENREQTGFDRGLPGQGLLIWHVDDSVPGNDNDAHRLLNLEEADGNDRPTQAADAWASNAEGWGPATTPDSDSYLNQRTGWKVRNISAAGATMTADLSREVDDDLYVAGISWTSAATGTVPRPWFLPTSGSVQVTVTVGNRGARTQQNFPVNLTVFRGDLDTPAGCCTERTVATLAQGQTYDLTWTVPVAMEGKVVLEATVPLAADEIPENNFQFAHFTAGTEYFADAMEAGVGSWTRNGTLDDPARWEIVQDGNESVSHSATHAWHLGRFACVTCLPGPAVHSLTSPNILVPAGPAYLYAWHRYDLRGRVELNGTVETDAAFVNTSVDGGPWRTEQTFSGVQGDWQLVAVNLTSRFATGGGTLRVQFSATSNSFTDSGGWWVDDVVVTRTPLRPGVAARAVDTTHTVEPGAVVYYRFKVANLGDWDDDVGFNVSGVPAGWQAGIGLNESALYAPGQFAPRLGPDQDATLVLGLAVAADAARGQRFPVTVIATSSADPSASAAFDTVTVINDPFGLAGLEKFVFLFIIMFAIVIVIAVVIDSIKKQKGVYRRW